jgi:hypothetical protein
MRLALAVAGGFRLGSAQADGGGLSIILLSEVAAGGTCLEREEHGRGREGLQARPVRREQGTWTTTDVRNEEIEALNSSPINR